MQAPGKQKSENREDQAQILACGDEQCIDRIASMAEEEVAVQSAVGLHVTDGGLDGRSPFQFPTHGGRQATLAAGDHHRSRAGIVVAAIALVDVDAVRVDAADLHRLIDRCCERVAIIRITLERFGRQHEALAVGCRDPRRRLSSRRIRRNCRACA